MEAVIFYGKDDLRMENIKVPKLGENDILIKVKAASICGTDIRIFTGEIDVNVPLVLGHDFSGIIAEVGKSATKFKKGDRVISEAIRYCRNCYYCKSGRYNLCVNGAYMGFEINGAFAEYVAVPDFSVFKVPENVSFEEAAITEPIDVALHVLDFVQLEAGETMAIIGQGPIGLVQTQVAKLHGIKVIAIDVMPKRLMLAKQFGADFTINPLKVDLKKAVLSITQGLGVDCAVEAVGSQATIDQAAEIAKATGKIVFIGEGKNLRGPPLRLLKELTTFEVVYAAGKSPISLDLISNRRVDVKKLITHEISLDELIEFMKLLSEKKIDAIKVVVKP